MLDLPRPTSTTQLTTFDPATGVKVAFVEPGERRTIGRVDGPGYLARLWLTLPGWFWAHWERDRLVDPRILARVVLRVFVDDADQPQLAAPLADLFGVGLCRVRSYSTRWLGAPSGGFHLALPMPFARSLRLEVENLDGQQRVDLFCNALVQRAPAAAELPVLHGFRSGGRSDGPSPLRILDVVGSGRYVGCTLSCQAQDKGYLSYLEAPEHLVADDELIVGTGMEDYFLGGWYFREGPVTGIDHAVVLKDALDGATAMLRIHDDDAVWFSRSLRMSFENPWSPDRLRPVAWSGVAFAYLDEPQGVPDVSSADVGPWFRWHDEDHLAIP